MLIMMEAMVRLVTRTTLHQYRIKECWKTQMVMAIISKFAKYKISNHLLRIRSGDWRVSKTCKGSSSRIL